MAITKDIKTAKSTQELQNLSFDTATNTFVFQQVGFDGSNVVRGTTDLVAKKITTDGTITYIASAAAGSAQSSAVWQVQKVDETDSDNVVITWADGNTNFDNVATDLTSLSYS